MRVLVTGASGFIGRWVVQGLVTRGHEVIAVSRNDTQVRAVGVAQVRWRAVDLLNQAEVESLIVNDKPSGLIHCAWEATPGTYWSSSENLKWVASSLQLIEAFARCGGQRVVVAGTSAEYDWSSDQSLHEETSPTAPDTLYGISKNALRHVLQQWATNVDLSLAWGRIFCPFGPGENSDRLVPRLIRQLRGGAPMPFDSGSLVRDFLAVQDVGDALTAVFDADFQGTVNVASGHDFSIAELVKSIARCVGNEQVDFGALPDPDNQPRRIVADTSRLEQTIAWTPSHSIEERIAETCRQSRSQPPETAQLKR